MVYRFFDMLRIATRDSILEGANQAGEILLQGTEVATERTESVARMEWAIHAVVGGEQPKPPPSASIPNSESGARPILKTDEAKEDEEPETETTAEGDSSEPKPKEAPRAAASKSTPRKPKPTNPADRRTAKSTVKSESIFDARPPEPRP